MSGFLNSFAIYILNLPRHAKRLLVLLSDISICIACTWLAFSIYFGVLFLNASLFSDLLIVSIVSVILLILIFINYGHYRTIFRYNGLSAMIGLSKALLWYSLIFVLIFSIYRISFVPRIVAIIQPLLVWIFIFASRAAIRIWFNKYNVNYFSRSELSRVFIYGAGSAGRQLASALMQNSESLVMGYLDDNSSLHGQLLNGLEIYDPEDISWLIKDKQVTAVLLAMPSVSNVRRNQILTKLSKEKVIVRTLPSLNDIISGKIGISDLRELDVDDLLGRDSIISDHANLNEVLLNKTVLVTGAGGSIGGELCRQLLKHRPKVLLLVDISEYSLYTIHLDLLNSLKFSSDGDVNATRIIPLLGSACDELRINEILKTWRPNTIYHAAAYKHVPLVEHNLREGLRNNVWGTLVCAQAAAFFEVENFVLISTDKAVRPTSFMGATKRLAEMLLQAMDSLHEKTRFSIVRFGNVLNSSGSVVPLFRKQISNGGPITLTHKDITRYFMTIPEAAQLVIQSSAISSGGDVFVLDMGKPVSIYNLAVRMVELSGLTLKTKSNPNGNIEIVLTGLRPGEKLYEELLIGNNPQATQHPLIMKAHEEYMPWVELEKKINELNSALNNCDLELMRELLSEIVKGYQPDELVVDWLWIEKNKYSK